jgi:4-alpha-glucanotransferase
VGPGVKLFDALKKNLGDVTIVAEDLGVITPDVVEVRLLTLLEGRSHQGCLEWCGHSG